MQHRLLALRLVLLLALENAIHSLPSHPVDREILVCDQHIWQGLPSHMFVHRCRPVLVMATLRPELVRIVLFDEPQQIFKVCTWVQGCTI